MTLKKIFDKDKVKMAWSLFLHIVASTLGLYLAKKFVSGVQFLGPFFVLPKSWQELSNFLSSLVAAGVFLGLLNFFVKPILKKITFPLRIITFNLFSFVLAMLMVWLVDIVFPELIIEGLAALFWTTLLVWGTSFIILKLFAGGSKN